MLFQSFSGLSDQSAVFDACVIGTGPAGMTLGLKLADAGFKTLVLEAGGEDRSDFSQSFYQGEVIGDKYFDLDASRLRYFGGTSNHWTGWCRPLDRYDFGPKAGETGGEWPITKADLDAFGAETCKILEIDPPVPNRDIGGGLQQIGFRWSPPVRFAKKYESQVRKSKNLFCALNSSVYSIECDGQKVTGLTIRNLEGGSHQVKSKMFVLAAGGIENSRLLLWSNQLNDGRLVKNATVLGRYWLEHPHYQIGEAIVTGALNFEINEEDSAFFAPSKQAIQENQIRNCGLRFDKTPYHGAKKLLADLACTAPELGEWFAGLFDRRLACATRIVAVWEQEPRAENRVALSAKKDPYGAPLADLHWRKSQLDLKTVHTAGRLLGDYLMRHDIGRLRLDPWLLGQADYPENDRLAGNHHLGGTRMSSDPAMGVVDKNCRLHGISNLYIAGSSVFPSGGHVNPTYTIIQLALRLADHLGQGA